MHWSEFISMFLAQALLVALYNPSARWNKSFPFHARTSDMDDLADTMRRQSPSPPGSRVHVVAAREAAPAPVTTISAVAAATAALTAPVAPAAQAAGSPKRRHHRSSLGAPNALDAARKLTGAMQIAAQQAEELLDLLEGGGEGGEGEGSADDLREPTSNLLIHTHACVARSSGRRTPASTSGVCEQRERGVGQSSCSCARADSVGSGYAGCRVALRDGM